MFFRHKINHKLTISSGSIFYLKHLLIVLGLLGAQSPGWGDSLVPQCIVDDFNKAYSVDEINKINKDLEVIKGITFDGKQTVDEQSIYVATAEGPGSGKSIILKTYLKDSPHFIYVDPDQRSLRFMVTPIYKNLTAMYLVNAFILKFKNMLITIGEVLLTTLQTHCLIQHVKTDTI